MVVVNNLLVHYQFSESVFLYHATNVGSCFLPALVLSTESQASVASRARGTWGGNSIHCALRPVLRPCEVRSPGVSPPYCIFIYTILTFLLGFPALRIKG